MTGRRDSSRVRLVVFYALLFLSCSSNPGTYHLFRPDVLPTVDTKGDRVKMGEVISLVPEASGAGVVDRLHDSIEGELERRDLIWPYSVHTVSVDIISYAYRDQDEINIPPIVWWALPAVPLGIALSPEWSIPSLCASGLSYVLDRTTKVGAFAMTVNVKVHRRDKELFSENVVIDISQREIPSEEALIEEMCERIADKVAGVVLR